MTFAPVAQARIFLLALIVFLRVAAPASSAPEITKAESAELLEYARGCLLARLDGASAPAPPEFATKRQRACFVTFFQGRRVFACFGGFSPRRANLAQEIDENVRLALKNDVRSRMVNRGIVLSAGVQITFPDGQPARVDNYGCIDPRRDGMLVEGQGGGVAFVPGEAKTASWAFREALRRLGEHNPAAVTIYKFKAQAVSTREHKGE